MTKYSVIINGNAGVLIQNEEISVPDLIRQAFADEGIDVDLKVLTGKALGAAIANAGDSETDRIIIGGGDGTVNTGASMAAAAGKILGILPMGTLNLYAHDLGIPLDLAQAVHSLIHGEIRRVDYAEVNGNLFLCNSMIGILPPLMAHREKLRGSSLIHRYGSLLWRTARLLKINARFYAKVKMNDTSREMKVRGIAVCNNEYHDSHALFPHKVPLDSGKLTVYLTGDPTRRGMLGIGLRVFLGTWEKEQDIETYETTEATIIVRQKKMPVVADGEILKLRPPLKYRIVPRGLRVMMPAETARRLNDGQKTF